MDFIVARNPDPQSALPFLLRLPIDGGLWLKAKESWPRSSRVYCHPAAIDEIGELEILERVPVSACVRRGPAIDLLLARGNNRRSQFVFTSARGRSMILWQTPKAAASARPGVRIAPVRAAQIDSIIVDTRERYGYKFGTHRIALVRRALPAGDYAVECGGALIAVERKTLDDFVHSLVNGSLGYAAAELAHLRSAAIVVEGTYSALLRHEYTRPGFLADLLARLQVRYPAVPIVFAESRKLAEEWTFRFLNAAHAEGTAMPLLSAMPAPPQPNETPKTKRKKRSEP